MNTAEKFSGCRAYPKPDIIRDAIAVTRQSADQLVNWDFSQPRSSAFIDIFNRGILYLLWHQAFAIGARAIRAPYVAVQNVSESSGLAVIRDKDSESGYKARLVWLPVAVREHMRQSEAIVQTVRAQHPEAACRVEDAVFFLDDNGELAVTPTLIEQVAKPFFPFPCNTPRRIMRSTLVQNSFPREMVDTFMGHWRERQEPWGKWSTFSYERYLKKLEDTIPAILSGLGFKLPERKGNNA